MSGGNDFPGSEHLRGKSPREILSKLCNGDPLALGMRSMKRLKDRALLIHPERVYVRALARTAYAAAWGYEGDPPLDQWLGERIDQTIESLIEDDLTDELSGTPPEEEDEEYFAWVARAADADLWLARRLCLVFNGMPLRSRRPFYDVVVEGKSVEQFAMETDTPPHRVQTGIEETIRTMVKLAEELGNQQEDES
jgi:hypothetical protein